MAAIRAVAAECCRAALCLPSLPRPTAVARGASRTYCTAVLSFPPRRCSATSSCLRLERRPAALASRQPRQLMGGGQTGKQPHHLLHSGRRAAAAAGAPAGTATEGEREILVQHLLVKEEQLPLLLDLHKRMLQEGEDLSDLATEHSICPSKANGGMIGWISRGRTVAEFEAAAFGAELHKVTRVKTKHGWHLLQVLAERQAPMLEQISPEDFAARLDAHREGAAVAQLVDVREPSEIATASIEGFRAYPLSQFGQWAPSIAEDLDPSKETYVLCHHGIRSQQAAEWLKSQGFSKLYNIVGGIDAYSKRVDPDIPRY